MMRMRRLYYRAHFKLASAVWDVTWRRRNRGKLYSRAHEASCEYLSWSCTKYLNA